MLASSSETPIIQGTHRGKKEKRKDQEEAGTQEREVCSLLRKNPKSKFTKTEIFNELVKTGKIEKRTPESSISRALSNLRDRALVAKLRDKKMGSFGVRISLWKIVETIQVGTQTDLFKP